jgi:hypothetical protein
MKKKTGRAYRPMGNNKNPKSQQRSRNGRQGRADNLQPQHLSGGGSRCNLPWNISVEQCETFLSM